MSSGRWNHAAMTRRLSPESIACLPNATVQRRTRKGAQRPRRPSDCNGLAVVCEREACLVPHARYTFQGIELVAAMIEANARHPRDDSSKSQLFRLKRVVQFPALGELFEPWAVDDLDRC